MKIWIINHYAKFENRHYFLAKHLIQKGHEVIIIASSFDHGTYKDEHLPEGSNSKIEDVAGVPFLWLKTTAYKGNDYKRVINMISFMGKSLAKNTIKLERPDVIVGSSMHLFAALGAAILAKRYRTPFVFEVRDLWPQSFIDLTGVSRYHPVVLGLEPIERYLYNQANKIITLLPDAHKHIIDKGALPTKIEWIPNGIDGDSLSKPVKPSDKNIFTITYAGSHGLANCLDSILDAALLLQTKDANRYEFRFIGRGLEKERLICRCRHEGICNIEFSDWIPRNQLYSELSKADCLIVNLKNSPLYKWGISLNKLYDYMASARPVVIGASVNKNPIEEAKSGITVPPEDAEGIARAIENLAAMSIEERWQMGLRGRHYVEEHHDYAKLAEKLEQVLYSAIDEYRKVNKNN